MLFDKEHKGSEELYHLTGIFPASARFESIRPEILSATDTVKGVVGTAVIDAANEIYVSDKVSDPGSEKRTFLDAVRLPVAYLAIAMHVRLSGVSHGETGRKLKVDDNEKIPFAWMLDRDDRELRETYLRALDALIAYVVAKRPELMSPEFRHRSADSIVKTLADFEAVYPIEGSHYMFNSLLPLILEVQREKLRGLLNDDSLYSGLVNWTQSSRTPSASLRDNCIRYVVLCAICKAVRRWSLDVFPLSIARRFAPSYQGNQENRTATKDEIEWYLANLSAQADEAKEAILSELNPENPNAGLRLIPDNDPRNKYFTV